MFGACLALAARPIPASASHEGAWIAGKGGAAPGIIMPGTFLLGSRYYLELAPGVALDLGTPTSSAGPAGGGRPGPCVEPCGWSDEAFPAPGTSR